MDCSSWDVIWRKQDWHKKQDELLTAYRTVWETAGGEPDIYRGYSGRELWLVICDAPEQLNDHGLEIKRRITDEYATAKAAETWNAHQHTKDFKAKFEARSEQHHPGIVRELKEIGGELQRREQARRQARRYEQSKRSVEPQQQKQTRNADRSGR